ncbi:MAG: hypothetical protein JSS02_17075 [Planctomycetes bacterium]|nr:hypothetical protein [Planctomycetota bacterium]
MARRPATRRRRSDFAVGNPAEILESRQLLAAAAAVTVAVDAGNVTITSVDSNNPVVAITRSGGNLVVTGSASTLITFGSKTASSQSIALETVNNLVVNLGTGVDTVNISGVSTTGSITIQGQSRGVANVSISAGTAPTTIAGSITADFGTEASVFNLFASAGNGNSLTVNGSVNIIQGGSGSQQVNLFGPVAGNPAGGRLSILGSVSVNDTGAGVSGLHIDVGVAIGGNLTFDNAANTTSSNNVQIFSSAAANGATSIAGAVSLALSQAAYQPNSVMMRGLGTALTFPGSVAITGGAGADQFDLTNSWFKDSVTIAAGSSPSFVRDTVSIDGCRFDATVDVSMTGSYGVLNLGTKAGYTPTIFQAPVTANLTGAYDIVVLSNSTATVNQVVFNSSVTLTGGAANGLLLIPGKYSVGPGQFTKTNFVVASRVAPPAASVTVSVQGNNLTVSSTDGYNPSLLITRSGGAIVITGQNGTQVSNGKTVAFQQSVPLATLQNLTILLGSGSETVTISGVSTTGDVVITGQSTGIANVSIAAGSTNTSIGGSVQANLGGEAATISLQGSANGGGTLTVNGSVNISSSGAGAHQVNLYGPPVNNKTGGKLNIKGSVSVLDAGTGVSGLRIDPGVAVSGNVLFDNSGNTVSANTVTISSNSSASAPTSIAGSLTLALAQGPYVSDRVLMQSTGTSLNVGGNTSITTGPGNDLAVLGNLWFKGAFTLDTGISPSGSNDAVSLDGVKVDGAASITESGDYATLSLGTNSKFNPTTFNGTLVASLTGASGLVVISNPMSVKNQVIFASTAEFIGGTPAGIMQIKGKYYAFRGKFTKVNFN